MLAGHRGALRRRRRPLPLGLLLPRRPPRRGRARRSGSPGRASRRLSPAAMDPRSGRPRLRRRRARDGVRPPPSQEPFYLPAGRRGRDLRAPVTRAACPVMLKGPTGCGKTRFVEHMAWRLAPAAASRSPATTISPPATSSVAISCRASETVWQDGPLTRAVRAGALCYLDEIVEARQDTVVVIHPLTDDRRVLPIDKTGELDRGRPGLPAHRLLQPGLPARPEGPQDQHAAALRGARVRLPAARARDAHRRPRGRRRSRRAPSSSSTLAGPAASAPRPRTRRGAEHAPARGGRAPHRRRRVARGTPAASPSPRRSRDDADLLAAASRRDRRRRSSRRRWRSRKVS